MPFPIKTCAVCSQQFELRPDKPGFANRCPDCTEAEAEAAAEAQKKSKGPLTAEERKSQAEQNEARRSAIRDLLYRKDS
jgi:predicted amidophosphoribosyltransferase